jgi:hypothetical protein
VLPNWKVFGRTVCCPAWYSPNRKAPTTLFGAADTYIGVKNSPD